MSRGLLPTFWWSSDLDALKSKLAANAGATDLGVQACPALPDTTRAAWGQFYSGLLTYTKSESPWFPGAASGDAGENYENQLYAWQLQLQKGGCTVVAVNPQPDLPGSAIIKYMSLMVVACIGAYVVHELVATVHETEGIFAHAAREGVGRRSHARKRAQGQRRPRRRLAARRKR